MECSQFPELLEYREEPSELIFERKWPLNVADISPVWVVRWVGWSLHLIEVEDRREIRAVIASKLPTLPSVIRSEIITSKWEYDQVAHDLKVFVLRLRELLDVDPATLVWHQDANPTTEVGR